MSLLQRSLSTPGNGGYSSKYEEQSWKTKIIFETPSVLYTLQLKVCQKWFFGKMKLLVIRSIMENKKFCIWLNPGYATPFWKLWLNYYMTKCRSAGGQHLSQSSDYLHLKLVSALKASAKLQSVLSAFLDWFLIIPFVDTLMILTCTFIINKLTISQSLSQFAFLISCDIDYVGVQELRIDVIFFCYCLKFIHSENQKTLFLVLTATCLKLRNFLLIH